MSTLVVQRARLGDFVQTLPLLRILSEKGEAVTLLVSEGFEGSAGCLFPDAEVLGFPARSLTRETEGSLLKRAGRLKEFWDVLGGRSWDRVIQLNHDGPGVLVARLVEARERRGFMSLVDRSVAGFSRIQPLGWPAYLVSSARGVRAVNRLHLSDIWIRFGPFAPDPAESGPPSGDGRGGGASDGPIGVVLSGRSPYRALGFERLSGWVAGLVRATGRKVILLGRDDEREMAGQIARTVPGGVDNLAGATTLPELVCCLSTLALLISPDTATLHLAASMNIPTLGLFFSSAFPHETGAFGNGGLSLVSEMDCYPCSGEGSGCTHLACRDAFRTEGIVDLASAIVGKKVLPAPDPGLRLLKGGVKYGYFENRPLFPVRASREDLLGLLFRRFFLRVLDPSRDTPSLEEERIGYRDVEPQRAMLETLEKGAGLFCRLPGSFGETEERVRLSREFPVLWPLVHHTEHVEGGKGDRALQARAYDCLAREAGELARGQSSQSRKTFRVMAREWTGGAPEKSGRRMAGRTR
jgi:ADP-heptose:LPS heptosyltransferase